MPPYVKKQVPVDGERLAPESPTMPSTWRDTIVRVLEEEAKPLHYLELSDLIQRRGYYTTEGSTPANTVSSTITGSINKEGDKSPFLRVGSGTYTLRALRPSIATTAIAAPAVVQPTTSPMVLEEAQRSTIEHEPDKSVICCFGMRWKRDAVSWQRSPQIFGKQRGRSKPVDFGPQRGLYILYDHHAVVYVGRSVDRPLGMRLYEHTVDRLDSRWDRFSWFGLRSVTAEGTLVEVPLKVTTPSLIATMEALLIETFEPPKNRKRGDYFSEREYAQDLDPERDIADALSTLERNLRRR